ncbi:MAG: helix-turn-helix transcriptional regulator [Lachnospiraceae bacterium]|nr:helix-turn-helix transcriptional regulator [Lachnospiraceae bacterium]
MSDEKLRQIFSKNLRHYLDVNGYSQADLARHMKVTTATTAKWCTGQTLPRIDKVQSICNWLGIKKTDLLEDGMNSEKDRYYINPETAKIAQQIYDDPDLHALFDAAADSAPEDMHMAADLLRRLKKTNPDG